MLRSDSVPDRSEIEMGHTARKVHDFAQGIVGRGQIIQQIPGKQALVWAAGSDQRGDGHAAAQI